MGTGNAECFRDDLSLSLQPQPSKSLLDPNCAPEISSNAFGASVYSISTPFARVTISNRDFTMPGLRQLRPGECEITHGEPLLVKQFASELITTTIEFLECIDYAPAHD
ncbi:hypothetical protein BKA70DRAFT_1440778 [Coprinopsis sp. MPI-PUGE-AT-0042]|nr:hypothetical protein BKA70DRAFT_1440778 [Coprinopsis sp. MPI-PUGE-AT-0042]